MKTMKGLILSYPVEVTLDGNNPVNIKWLKSGTGLKPLKHQDWKIDWKKLEGTTFQKDVWRLIAKIPKGKTATYLTLSQKLGKPKAFRALANACGKNPLPLIVPCHRVVASKGLGGYSGGTGKDGLTIKKNLLDSEQVD
jgi:methylated-DNA-[protein]-cysteine S-methyltransferase